MDVAVIGAGITGLTAAELLQRAGLEVVVLEAEHIGFGVTGFSTGHVTELVDARYSRVRRHFGKEAARTMRHAARAAIDLVGSLAEAVGPGAGHETVAAYLFAEEEKRIQELDEEIEAAMSAGVEGKRIENVPLPFTTRAAFRVGDQAQIDPLSYTQGLAWNLIGRVEVFEKTRVDKIEHGRPCRVHAEGGATVEAKKVILATHTPLGFHAQQTVIAPYRSYVLGCSLASGEAPQGLFFDLAEPYHYLRSCELDGERLLVVGGADHKTGHEGDQRPYEVMERYARERFDVEEVRFRWSAEVFESADGVPYIGPSPMQENLLISTGYSGDGLLFGTAAAILLTAQAQEIEHGWASVFRPSRIKPLAAGAAFIKENADVVARFVGDRLRVFGDSIEDVRPGEGKVLRTNGELVAVHRDHEGRIHSCSAICTHLRCVVEWNHSDATWDCPCHGARYRPTGEVLSGPATKPLARVEADGR